MPDRKLEREVNLDSSVLALTESMEKKFAEAALPRRVREKKARERAKIQARKQQRATYDLPPALRQQVMALSEELRLPASQLVTLALARFFAEYQTGSIDLGQYKTPSRSPRYDWNLVLPEELLPAAPPKKRRGG
ncbi:MAG: hypothetical protein HGA53_03160 [Anaerolineaceae bacterium]|nr:hypothetical protein [Anaerolineaceae bacterium]